MSFEGIDWSVAGAVVALLMVMTFSLGDVLFGRRRWESITGVAACLFVALLHFSPAPAAEGLTRFANKVVDRIDWPELPATSTTAP